MATKQYKSLGLNLRRPLAKPNSLAANNQQDPPPSRFLQLGYGRSERSAFGEANIEIVNDEECNKSNVGEYGFVQWKRLSTCEAPQLHWRMCQIVNHEKRTITFSSDAAPFAAEQEVLSAEQLVVSLSRGASTELLEATAFVVTIGDPTMENAFPDPRDGAGEYYLVVDKGHFDGVTRNGQAIITLANSTNPKLYQLNDVYVVKETLEPLVAKHTSKKNAIAAALQLDDGNKNKVELNCGLGVEAQHAVLFRAAASGIGSDQQASTLNEMATEKRAELHETLLMKSAYRSRVDKAISAQLERAERKRAREGEDKEQIVSAYLATVPDPKNALDLIIESKFAPKTTKPKFRYLQYKEGLLENYNEEQKVPAAVVTE